MTNFFDPAGPVERRHATLPHWRQDGTTYFVTFRLADSLPEEALAELRELAAEREDADSRRQGRRDPYSSMNRIQSWLDRGCGSCILGLPDCRSIVEGALRFFERERYRLDEFVVAANHAHAIVTPSPSVTLSSILQSWKSFTAKEILRVIANSPMSAGFPDRRIWQRESFDHIVRSPESLEKTREYIRGHVRGSAGS